VSPDALFTHPTNHPPTRPHQVTRPGDHDDYARQTALQRELVFFDKVCGLGVHVQCDVMRC
jgi:hypothetical protein